MKKCLITISVLLAINFAYCFKFAVVGDRTGACVPGIFEEVINEVALLEPCFVICVGDLIHGYTDDSLAMHAQWDTFIDIVGRLPCKFYFVPGNHDIGSENDRFIYERRTGVKRYYSFDFQNSHFIVLDNTMVYWAQPQDMDDEQLKWLENDLKINQKKENIFVFYHIPTYLYALVEESTDTLMTLFEKYNVTGVFTGHHHTYSYLERNGIQYVSVGSSGGGIDNVEMARGLFFQWIMADVKGVDLEIAAIKKGGVLPRNIVTADDLRMIERADHEVVTIDPLIAADINKPFSQEIALKINNYGPYKIEENIKWNIDAKVGLIIPATQHIAIEPDQTGEYKFKINLNTGSNIYPLPSFKLNFPISYEKSCTLRPYLPIRRIKKVIRSKKPINLDGELNELIWQKTEPINHLVGGDFSTDIPVEKTEVHLCHDDGNLYLGIRCYESNLDAIVANATENDGGSPYDDNLWFFIDSNNDKTSYYQAIINSKGIVFDRHCHMENGQSIKDISWNGPWQIAAGQEKDAWILEIAIPKAGLVPFDEKIWGFNFRRLQPRPTLADAAYWSLPFMHDPATFSLLEFE